MAEVTVRFRRERAGYTAVNFWIKPLDGDWAKLRFQNDKAKTELVLGQNYVLFWDAVGVPDSELSVERKIDGQDDDFQPLLTKWKLPDNPNTPSGVPDRYRDQISFIL